jgi:DNA-binding MarR family transcriptional regulator
MNPDPTLSQVLHSWAEVFMRQSFTNFKRYMDEWDLSPSQISALFMLHHCTKCGISDIGEHLGVTNAAASQMVERLVKQGLITRMEDPGDRRFKLIQLTQQGQSAIEEGIRARLEWLEQMTTAFTPEQQESIAAAMVLLTKAAREIEAGAAASASEITRSETES